MAWATAGFVLVECGPQSDGDLTGALPATSNVCGCEDASQECESTKGEVLALAETCREFCEERDDEDYTVRECDAAAMERIMASPRPACAHRRGHGRKIRPFAASRDRSMRVGATHVDERER